MCKQNNTEGIESQPHVIQTRENSKRHRAAIATNCLNIACIQKTTSTERPQFEVERET